MKANILVVDDDSNIIKVIKDFLEMENYNIYVAEDGKTALMLLGEKIDLIILDINLPDIDGIELCKKVRNYLNVPIIFLSARIEESDGCSKINAGIRHTTAHTKNCIHDKATPLQRGEK